MFLKKGSEYNFPFKIKTNNNLKKPGILLSRPLHKSGWPRGDTNCLINSYIKPHLQYLLLQS